MSFTLYVDSISFDRRELFSGMLSCCLRWKCFDVVPKRFIVIHKSIFPSLSVFEWLMAVVWGWIVSSFHRFIVCVKTINKTNLILSFSTITSCWGFTLLHQFLELCSVINRALSFDGTFPFRGERATSCRAIERTKQINQAASCSTSICSENGMLKSFCCFKLHH